MNELPLARQVNYAPIIHLVIITRLTSHTTPVSLCLFLLLNLKIFSLLHLPPLPGDENNPKVFVVADSEFYAPTRG